MKKITLILITGAAMLLTGFAYRGDSSLIYTSPDVKPEMLDAEYWTARVKDADRVLLTAEEIKALNIKTKASLTSAGEPCYDLISVQNSYTAEKKAALINNMKRKPETVYYSNGKPLDDSFWEETLANCNTDVKPDARVDLAICTRNSSMMLYPTENLLNLNTDVTDDDNNCNSTLILGEGFAVLHRSLDGKWCYGCNETAYGWVRTEDLAMCGDPAMWNAYMNAKDFLVVTANRFRLEDNRTNQQTSGLEITMGTKLMLAPADPGSVNSRSTTNSYTVILPNRDAKGSLIFSPARVPYSADVSRGYLPYTTKNVLNQLFKTIGDPYGWGGDYRSRDCSSLSKETYSCFGIYIPRNSTTQSRMGGYYTEWPEGTSAEQKLKDLKKARPGSILRLPGHIMLYLGQVDGKAYVISAMGSTFPYQGAELQKVNGVNVNTLNVYRRNGKSWLDNLTHVMRIVEK